MSSKKANRVLLLVLLLIVLPALSIASGGRELADEKDHKEHYSTAASGKGATMASGDMVKTNDYGRYDPTPAYSKPRFKLIPN